MAYNLDLAERVSPRRLLHIWDAILELFERETRLYPRY